MGHSFNSTNDRLWLNENHQKRSNRSVEIGKQAIDLLVKKGESVTYTSISYISKEIDPEGKGIHPNTIRTNEQLYEYYKQNSLTYKQKENSKNVKPLLNNDIDYHKVKPNRNVDNAQRKYMKLSKKELVHRLILAEQYIAEKNSKWVANHFEMFK
ncbi:hypothetical protein [Heyndrickxia oleronia]|jgi:hypothetical protein|uniref:hypothetical protein n=1 Tax=Heyndrickxia oleronia TaxID=38875 RepID=UPI00242D71DA|nr:hypothetical protein [Heyndrickxia oleronia]MCI1591137.1 hypothetical protein [Heyndrickxia oleronia]MCI1614637.1 hypothetical protein [Heyndrickxia oleronia]MCI1745512.1 hypothetical protein [Heyndrickxia oleronia]MCI1762529.1 hypothetical protein [Heyndrickxia oleronia]